MQAVDIAILVIISLPAIVGAIIGLFSIVLSLLAWVSALGIAIIFYPDAAPLLESLINESILRKTLAFIGLFASSLTLLTGIGFLMGKLLGSTGLTAVSRMFGLIFGIIMGCIIVETIIFFGGFTELPQKPLWSDSKIIQPFEKVADQLGQYLPEDISHYHKY